MSQTKPHLELTMRNFGPIREGTVALKPLTVFIGPNNSGKSYAAMLVYALQRACRSNLGHAVGERFPGEQELDPLLVSALEQLGIDGRKRLADTTTLTEPLPASLHTLLFPADLGASPIQPINLGRSLHDSFGISKSEELERGWPSKPGMERRLDVSIAAIGDDSLGMAYRYEPGQHAYVTRTRGPAALKPEDFRNLRFQLALAARDYYSIPAEDLAKGYRPSFIPDSLYGDVRQTIANTLAGYGLAARTHYLPAARTGLMLHWRDLTGARIDHAEGFSLNRPTTAVPLGSPTVEILRTLRDTAPAYYPEAGESPLAAALTLLHEALLRGQIVRTQLAGFGAPDYQYQPAGSQRTIPLRMAASTITELAPLDIWLQYVVQPGDLLIIDEPEAHLHPENQRLVARVLVRLVNAGVRVLCTTHSSVIIHQLSNCLLAGVPGAAPLSDNLLAADVLDYANLSVNLFDPTTRGGATIRPVEVDPHWGIAEDTFVSVAEELSQQSAELLTAGSHLTAVP